MPGDSCSGGDVESRLDGEMLPCPVGGKYQLLFSVWSCVSKRKLVCIFSKPFSLLTYFDHYINTSTNVKSCALTCLKIYGLHIFHC